jgi:hypothetical protein
VDLLSKQNGEGARIVLTILSSLRMDQGMGSKGELNFVRSGSGLAESVA